jgi:hypothetical protein
MASCCPIRSGGPDACASGVTDVGNTQQFSVESIATTPGWTAIVTDSGGKKVRVLFRNAASGARAEAKVEAGETNIR